MIIQPSFDEFKRLSRSYTLIPVWAEIPGDLETPVSAFLKIRQGPYSFLLESVEQEEKLGRYSFLGTAPETVVTGRSGAVKVLHPGTGGADTYETADPLTVVEKLTAGYRQPVLPQLDHFTGGFLGYVSYDYVRVIERLPDTTPDKLSSPDLCFILVRSFMVFDHFKRKIILIANGHVPEPAFAGEVYRKCVRELETMKRTLDRPLAVAGRPDRSRCTAMRSNVSNRRFEDEIRRAKRYIKAGDIIQVVLSQRWEKRLDADPFNIYRALRFVNPSPYMFYLEAAALKLVGSSPEILVRLEGNRATVRPIAGTRPRGRDERREKKLEAELLADEKERAEHVMLVDLGRNDLGRVCAPGTVRVTELMGIEKYSHVMHLVSNVEGSLAAGRTQFDLLRAAFPAGTVSGAPKIRAMEIIEELETEKRGPYAGAVGYFSFRRNMDFCITIRTLFVQGNTLYLQAGAGIVADSRPAREYIETVNKAAGLVKACELARKL